MPKHILVVDDNRHIRKAVCEMILSDSRLAPCSQAENGLEAVQKATRDQPDLVVMDFSMPVMNGLEASRLIIRALPKVYIILVTLHPEILNEAELAKFGISAMVPKQRAGTDLIPAIRLLLGLTSGVGAA
jgi:CheY-like chemotaxis protein